MQGLWRECRDPEPWAGTPWVERHGSEGKLDSEEDEGHFFAEGSCHKLSPPWALIGSLSIPYLRLHF